MIRRSIERPLLILSGILLTISLASYAYVGLFSRYIGDDYCTAGSLRSLGFFRSQSYWYQSWSGRFAFTFTVNLAESIGPEAVPFVLIITLIVWLLSTRWVISQLLQVFKVEIRDSLVWLLAALELTLVLAATPDIYQSLFWLTGLVTYTLPLVFFTLQVAIILRLHAGMARGGLRHLSYIGLFAIAFWTGGYSETAAVLQVVFFVGCCTFFYIIRVASLRTIRDLLFPGFVGALTALVVVVLAPGSEARLSIMPEKADFWAAVGHSIRDLGIYFSYNLHRLSFANAIAFFVPAIAVFVSGRNGWRGDLPLGRMLFLIPLFTFSLLLAVMLPSEFATGAYPIERVMISAEAVRVTGLGLMGLIVGLKFRSKEWALRMNTLAANMALVVLTLACSTYASLQSAGVAIDWLPKAKSYADLWDARDAQIRFDVAGGADDLSVRSLPHLASLGEVEFDPSEWINLCIAQYYGLVSIKAK